MKKWLYLLLALALCFGTACAAGEFDWLKEWDDLDTWESYANAYCVCRDGLWGTVDGNGNILVEPQFDEPFCYEESFFPVRINMKYGFADGSGEMIVPAEYESACQRIKNGLGWVRKDGKYALVNENGLATDFVFENVNIPAMMKDGKWGMVNADGECPAGFVFDEIDTYSLAGRIGEKYAVLDEQGEILLPAEYDQINRPYDSDLILFVKDGVEGWLNTEDGSYVETQYHGLESEEDGYVRYEWNGKTGFLDMEGNFAAEFDGDNVYGFNGEYAEVITDYFDRGVINRDGERILEKKYTIDGKIDRHNIVKFCEKGGDYVYCQIVDDELVPISTLNYNTASSPVKLDGPLQMNLNSEYPVPKVHHTYNTYAISAALVNGAKVAENDGVDSDYTALFALESSITDIYFAYEDQLPGVFSRWSALQTKVPYEYSSEAQQLGWDYFWLDDDSRLGWEYVCTPVAKDALVFVTHADNPVENISSDDLRGIFSGKITDWSMLGGNPGEIISYQYNPGSGTQELFLDFMEGTPPVEPDATYFLGSDGEKTVLGYRNLPDAIGFCRRIYSLDMAKDIKVLSVDGIYPTAENIANGSYPWTELVYAVTRSDTQNPNVQNLLDWLLTEQGSELVGKSGYIPLQ